MSRPGGNQPQPLEPEAAEWVQRRSGGQGVLRALYAAALSSDGRFLAVGGGDRKVGKGGQEGGVLGERQHLDSGLHVVEARTGGHTSVTAGCFTKISQRLRTAFIKHDILWLSFRLL
jgi:hypothetical protein